MESVVSFFEKFINRSLAIILSYIILFTALVMWFILIIPFVINQSAGLIKIFVDKIIDFQHTLQTQGLIYVIQQSSILPWYIKNLLINTSSNSQLVEWLQQVLQKNIAEIVSFGSSYVKNVWEIAVWIVGKFLSVIVQILFVFVIAIFFSLEKDKVIGFLAIISWRQEYMKKKFEKLYNRLGNWLKWQILLCFFIGITVYIGLWTMSLFWMDLPNRWTLALIAWIMEFIPIIWPTLGAIPMALIALSQYGFVGLLVIVIFYTILQLMESNILVPLVMKQALWVSALLILITMTLGWVSFGFIWVLLWVPLAVILSLIFEDFIEND